MKYVTLILFAVLTTLAGAQKKAYQIRMELTTLRGQSFSEMKKAGLVNPEIEAAYHADQLKARDASLELSTFKKEHPEAAKLGDQASGLERNLLLSEMVGNEKLVTRYKQNRTIFYRDNAANADKIREYLALTKKGDDILNARYEQFVAALEKDAKGKSYAEKVRILEKELAESEMEVAKKFVAKWK